MKVYRALTVAMSLAAMMTPSAAAAWLSTREVPLAVEQKVTVGQKVTVTTGGGQGQGKVLSLHRRAWKSEPGGDPSL